MRYCTAAEHFSRDAAEGIPGGPVTGSHYLMDANPRGPWRLPEGGFLDGALPCRRYAARIVQTDAGPQIIGFADRPEGEFIGQLTDPDPVVVAEDGRLSLRKGS